MKIVRICEEADAIRLYNEGLFFPFVKERIPEYPSSKLAIIKNVKDNSNCGLYAAKCYVDSIYDMDAQFEYSDKGAITQSGRLLRKIGNVWVERGDFNDSLSFEDLFGELPVTDVPEFGSTVYGKDIRKAAVGIAQRLMEEDIYANSYIRISDDEIWHKKMEERYHMALTIYRSGSTRAETIWITYINKKYRSLYLLRDYLERRRLEKKASFGEF